jgi:hypothetical protein
MSNSATSRLSLAKKIAQVYAFDPNVRAVLVAGSVARGWADVHSDLELHVFVGRPPSHDDRARPINSIGGVNVRFWPYEEDEWSDRFLVQGVKVELSRFLVDTMEHYLHSVIDDFDTSWTKQMLIAAVQHSIALYGSHEVERWRSMAAAYPAGLAQAMGEQYSWFPQISDLMKLVERKDLVPLYASMCESATNTLALVHAINHQYLSHRLFKWTERTLRDMRIAPKDLSDRLIRVFVSNDPSSSVVELSRIVEEVKELAATFLPHGSSMPSHEKGD